MAKKMGYQAFLEDQKKKEEEAKKGQVRFREASAASRIQYTNPSYTGNSKNANYKWETEALKTVKMPKGSSRTYNSKFDYLTKQMGLSSNEADDFRKYMDFQEDQNKTAYEKKIYDNKTDKKGKLITYDKNGNEDPNGTYLKQARTSTSAGTSLNTKSSIIDNILNGMTSRAVQSVKDSDTKATKKTETKQPKKQDKSFLSKAGNNIMKGLEIIDRPGDAVRTGIKEKVDGNSFWQGAKEGFTGEKNTSGTELNKRLGFDPTNDKKDLNLSRKITDVLLAAGPTKFALPFLNDGIKNKVAQELPGAGTEMALDPLNLVGGGTAKIGREALSLPSQLSKVLEATDGLRYSDEAMKAGAEEAARGVSSPYIRQRATQHPEDIVAQQTQQTAQPLESLQNFSTNDIPQATVPNVLDDLLNFAQSGQGPQARGIEKIANPARYAKENVSSQADNILNRLDQVNGPTDYNKRILDVQKSMQDINNNDVYTGAQQAMDGRQSAEDAFVEKYLAPHVDKATREVNGHQVGDIAKNAKDEIERIKGTYGKIKATAGEEEDYPIPPQFRAGVNNMAHDDLHSFATQEGFNSADEAVQYLQHLDQMSKMKPTKSGTKYTEDFWNNLENEARQTFRQSDEGQALDEMAASILNDKPNFDALYNNARTSGDPQSFDELVRLAQMQSAKPDLKASLKQDPRVRQALDQLNALGGKNTSLPGVPQAQPDTSAIDDVLKFLSQNENVNNSQDVGQVIDELVSPESGSKKLSMDDFNALVRGETPKKPEANVTSEGNKSLLGLNLQRFKEGTDTGDVKLFNTDGKIESDKAITKVTDKFYENYVNRNHGFKVTEKKLLEKAIAKAKADGKVKKAAQLEGKLKEVKRSGSDFEKAVSNEKASGVAAKAFLTRHFKALDGIVNSDEQMAEALTYQVAKDLQWRKENGLAEYELPDGVDWGQINDIANRGDQNPKLADEFTGAIRSMTQEWRDIMLDSGLISKESYDALSKNPYYMPLARELSNKLDNIDRSLGGRTTSNMRASGPTIVHSMGKGDLDSFFKNPVETLTNNTFAVYKNAYKEETARQISRLAKLDTDGVFVKEISGKAYQEGGGIKSANGGKPKYYRLQDDLMKALKENDEVMDTDMLGKLTNMFAGLKTRSIEYQITAAPRDLATSYLNSQITNPFRYMSEAMKSIKSKNASVKEIGGYFDKAYNDHVGGLDPQKVMDEFKRQYTGSVRSFNPKSPQSWKEAATVLKKYLDIPFKPAKFIGEATDNLPRDIEARETERLFMQKHGEKINNLKTALEDIDNRLAQTEGITDEFDPRLQGVDKLQEQKKNIEGMLNQYQRDLNREKLFRSRDVINYSRQGRGGVAKKIRQWVVFANTTTQSKDKLVRAFIERPGATIFKAALAMSPFITAQKIMYETMSADDRATYDKIPNYVKQMNYVFVNNGKLYTVPKIQELALISDPIEAALQGEELNSSAKFLAKEGVPYQVGNVAQGLIPDSEGNTLFNRDPMTKNMSGVNAPSTVLTPGLDLMVNDKTGFNRKPISYSDKKANDWTLDAYKKIGNTPNADALQYLVEQLGGDYGKYAGRVADYATNPTNMDKLDEMLRYLNPLQDRYYNDKSKLFRPVPQESLKSK
jgi:hypothetical protein